MAYRWCFVSLFILASCSAQLTPIRRGDNDSDPSQVLRTSVPGTLTPQADIYVENETWRITLTNLEDFGMLPDATPRGRWVILYGRAENRSSQQQNLRDDHLYLSSPTVRHKIGIDRWGTQVAAKRQSSYYSGQVSSFGGVSVPPRHSLPIIMAFDVPVKASELFLVIPPLNQQIALGSLAALAFDNVSTLPPRPAAHPTPGDVATDQIPGLTPEVLIAYIQQQGLICRS